MGIFYGGFVIPCGPIILWCSPIMLSFVDPHCPGDSGPGLLRACGSRPLQQKSPYHTQYCTAFPYTGPYTGPQGLSSLRFSTGLRRLKHIPDKNISAILFECVCLTFGFLLKISGFGFGLDRKVREGVSSISSNFHPNPTTGSPKSCPKYHSP